jgi:predicted GIY-YIG superfamily endonuclease
MRDRWFESNPCTQLESPPAQSVAGFFAVNYFVYVLRNSLGRHYIGLSQDVVRRVEQHNSGVSQWTSSRGPWSLVWQSEPLTLSDARKLENLLKRQKGGDGFYRITRLQRNSGS